MKNASGERFNQNEKPSIEIPIENAFRHRTAPMFSFYVTFNDIPCIVTLFR